MKLALLKMFDIHKAINKKFPKGLRKEVCKPSIF